ncbi:hypothetical protein BT93_L3246 [Corymbia citriodora subsp. variegata]|uniref:H(+)-exporting diphosphatase n=1 Tax=Corymbia citriodora subsp. variegata TaxID=360336 RepID=A0A8T0CM05_CORYI|nr:hypothetical protein BT93_L3246 [Corymbia citriodora subsp. variegata]
MALLSALATEIAILVCAIIGIAYSYYLVRWFPEPRNSNNHDDEEKGLIWFKDRCASMKRGLSKGLKANQSTKSWYVGVFMVGSAIIIYLCLGSVKSFSTQSRPCRFYPSNMCKPVLATAVLSAVSFLLGAFTSVLSSFLGMQIAIYANERTAFEEIRGVGNGFNIAFRSGAAMGFLLPAINLLVLYIAIDLFMWYYGDDWEGLFEAIIGYGLGGSSMALFGRAVGGTAAKAADICSYLLSTNVPLDDRSSAVIPNVVGDVAGDIADTWIDLFGSYAESSCTALLVASISFFGIDHNFTAMCYPLLVNSMGILVCLITTLFWPGPSEIKEPQEIKRELKKQLVISTILMTVGIVIVSSIALPSSFAIYNFGSLTVVKNWQLGLCVGVGLWAGLAIGDILDAIANIPIFGLALGKIPIFAAISVCVSYSFAAFYGATAAAVGMLSTIATRLAIDAYGPISDNAKRILRKTHAIGDYRCAELTAAAANHKRFAIESAALVSIALFGAFVSRAKISLDVLTTKTPIGFIGGIVLPYLFYYFILDRVGRTASCMFRKFVQEIWICSEEASGSGMRDHDTFVGVSTDASIRGMIPLVALVMLTPIIIGTLFGVEALSGVLAGSLGSVFQTGFRKEAKTHGREDLLSREYDETIKTNGKEDPSGPLLNILIQLMAVESLVFAPFFATHVPSLPHHLDLLPHPLSATIPSPSPAVPPPTDQRDRLTADSAGAFVHGRLALHGSPKLDASGDVEI